MMKTGNIIPQVMRLKASFFKDTNVKKFEENNMKRWGKCEKKENIILVERNSLPHCIISWSYFANHFKNVYDADIYTYSNDETIINYALNSMYESFGSKGNIRETLDSAQHETVSQIQEKLFRQCKSKKDWYNAKVVGLNIGIDIYESYLALGNPTLDINDKAFYTIVRQAVEKVIFWDKKLGDLNVKVIIISHDCYLGNIIRRLANKKSIPVYQITTNWGVKLTDGFSFGDRYQCYRELFAQLSSKQQQLGKNWARRQLERRLNGEVGVDMYYSKSTSFDDVDTDKHVLQDNENIKVLICPQCFYDNPNGQGDRLFIDYYDWLCYLGELSNITNYDWYIKLHPDYRIGEKEILQKIIDKYPKIQLIDENISHKQLAYEGLDFALTVHGTVACEYPLLGVQVINAGNNPHVAYDFSWTPLSLAEYRDWLLNLDKLHKDINMDEIYEFYCVHHLYGNYDSNMRGRDDLIFKSEKNMRETLGDEVYTSKMYRYFLDELDDERHEIIKKNVKQYFQQINDYDMSKLYIRE